MSNQLGNTSPLSDADSIMTAPLDPNADLTAYTANLDAITKWFSGKGLTVCQDYVLPTLRQAAIDGCWPKGAARKVRAALNKQAVAVKFAKAHEKFLERVSTGTNAFNGAKGWDVQHAMYFGSMSYAISLPSTIKALRTSAAKYWMSFEECRVTDTADLGRALTPDERTKLDQLLDTAAQWATDFAPIACLLDVLDVSRPRQTIRVHKTLSPLVAANVGTAMGIKLDTIKPPEVKEAWKIRTIKGKPVRITYYVIVWPVGTRHDTSKHADGWHCHACGHQISNPFNWVPLIAERAAQSPASLWVGRDCAQKLLGVEVDGEALYEGAPSTPVED